MHLPTLEGRFGRYGARLYELARGIDESDVGSSRPPPRERGPAEFYGSLFLPTGLTCQA